MVVATAENTSVLAAQLPLRARKIREVPYVELFGRRVQGVVSSGSDENRVYVAFFAAGTTNFNCSTNNNRPCGGLRGSPCKHGAQDVWVWRSGTVRKGPAQTLPGSAGDINLRGTVLRARRRTSSPTYGELRIWKMLRFRHL